MVDEKDKTVVERINTEIEKIDKKENTVFFYVLDTQGNPSGSLEYIYKLALLLKEGGYKVEMLYQTNKDEEFVGVKDWLGEKYAELPHEDISSENVKVSPSDILFIPEIFSNVMLQTKKLPCKRVALLQNFDYIADQTPISAQWGTYGIVDAITNTEANKELLKEIFPYVRTTVVEPYIDEMYGTTKEPKKLIVNIIARNQDDINRIIKPFYWKYPMFKFVSFRDVRGFPKEMYSQYLREAAITIWADENSSFGYGALEAMKSGSVVLAKTTVLTQPWMEAEEKGVLSDCCVWFNNYHELSRLIASVVRAWITNNMPTKIEEDVVKALAKFDKEKTREDITAFIESILRARKSEMEGLIQQINNKKDEVDNG